MEPTTIAKFRFDNFKIRKSHFEIKDDVEIKTFSIGFSPKGILYKDESKYQLELGVLIEGENKSFKAEIIAIGVFYFDQNADDAALKSYFYTNAPAILFPYVRAYLSALTTLSGTKPITIPTLNLSNLAPELQKNTVTN